MLRRLGLQLLCRGYEWDQSDMDEHRIIAPQLLAHLPDGFHERQRFNIADRAANFDDRDVHILRNLLHRRFDFVSDVRNYLDGLAEIISATLLRDDLLVNAPGGPVVIARKFGVSETLVVPEVEVGFGAVIGDEDFAVLKRRHGAGIHVEVWIELHQVDREATTFEQAPDGSRRQSLAE